MKKSYLTSFFIASSFFLPLSHSFAYDKPINSEIKALKKQADHHSVYAQYKLGIGYAQGWGTSHPDIKEAEHWLKKAIDGDNDNAKVALVKLYLNNYKNCSITGDCKDALRIARHSFFYLRDASNDNNKNADYLLGLLYQEGKIVPKNDRTSLSYFQKAANEGKSDALVELGKIYLYGWGVPVDIEKAGGYFLEADDAGNAQADNELGKIFLLGNHVPVDIDKATLFFKKSADKGDPEGLSYYQKIQQKAQQITQAEETKTALNNDNQNNSVTTEADHALTHQEDLKEKQEAHTITTENIDKPVIPRPEKEKTNKVYFKKLIYIIAIFFPLFIICFLIFLFLKFREKISHFIKTNFIKNSDSDDHLK